MFVWDTNFGGELDVIDYRTGRATFVANYQAILGDEFRHFDPNQGQLHPERIGVDADARASKWPASSITSRGTWPIAPTAWLSRGT